MSDKYTEYNFIDFCKTCIYSDLLECEEPCCECLENPIDLYSCTPMEYKPYSNY